MENRGGTATTLQETNKVTFQSDQVIQEILTSIEELYKRLEPVYVNFPQAESNKEPSTSAVIQGLKLIQQRLDILKNGIVI